MKGYPKHINTVQDFKFLLADPKYREQALKDLRAITKVNDSKAARVVSGSEETGDLIIEEINNPMPLWKKKGFESLGEILTLIQKEASHLQT